MASPQKTTLPLSSLQHEGGGRFEEGNSNDKKVKSQSLSLSLYNHQNNAKTSTHMYASPCAHTGKISLLSTAVPDKKIYSSNGITPLNDEQDTLIYYQS